MSESHCHLPVWQLKFVLSHSSYQICEFMYERAHQYDKIIDCYLHDPLREVSLKMASPVSEPPPQSYSPSLSHLVFVEFLL